jgi:hypothetical protein
MAVACRASQLPSRYDSLGAVNGWWMACKKNNILNAYGRFEDIAQGPEEGLVAGDVGLEA